MQKIFKYLCCDRTNVCLSAEDVATRRNANLTSNTHLVILCIEANKVFIKMKIESTFCLNNFGHSSKQLREPLPLKRLHIISQKHTLNTPPLLLSVLITNVNVFLNYENSTELFI